MAFGGGFSVLAWVKPSSTVLVGVEDPDSRQRLQKQLLNDFAVLVGTRWSMDVTVMHIDGQLYAYGNNTRITVGKSTLSNAIGDLCDHVEFLRSSSHSTADELVNYKQCKDRWKVPETVTDSTTGWEAQGQAETSTMIKRRRT